MTYRKTDKSSSRKVRLSQILPIWTTSQSDAAIEMFQELLSRLGITDAASYFRKLRIPIVISTIAGACIGTYHFGLKGFFIGGLLGLITPIALIWIGFLLVLVAVVLAIYFIAWAAIFYGLRWLFFS